MVLNRIQSDRWLCPYCHSEVCDEVHAHWGLWPEPRVLRIGDELNWLRDANGDPLTSYVIHKRSANIGDPQIPHLWLLDENHLDPWWEPHCPHCREAIDGVGVEIIGNRISDARVFRRGDLFSTDEPLPQVTAIEVADGKLVPRPEFYDHPMKKA